MSSNLSAAHTISDFLDGLKESLTDAQYKEGMELCQKLFNENKPDEKLYEMTYLRPYTFMSQHCEAEDCDDMKFLVSFTKTKTLVRLSDRRAERIRETHMFMGSEEDMKSFIEIDLLRSFPDDAEDLGVDLQWYEFPVIALDLVGEGETTHA